MGIITVLSKFQGIFIFLNYELKTEFEAVTGVTPDIKTLEEESPLYIG